MFNFFRAKTAGVTAKNVKEVLGAASVVSMVTFSGYVTYKTPPLSSEESDFKVLFTPAGVFPAFPGRTRQDTKLVTSELKNPEAVSHDAPPLPLL